MDLRFNFINFSECLVVVLRLKITDILIGVTKLKLLPLNILINYKSFLCFLKLEINHFPGLQKESRLTFNYKLHMFLFSSVTRL